LGVIFSQVKLALFDLLICFILSENRGIDHFTGWYILVSKLYIPENDMTFYVKDPETDKAVRKLAKLKGTTLTEAIRSAVEKDLAAMKVSKLDVDETAIDAIIARFASWPNTGLKADKEFFDSLNDE
jgi:antitoxin VapB